MGAKEVIICIVAGLGAGLGTGFAGMSAAAIISPLLIVFLNVPAYNAVAIALASDVLASGVSAAIYAKNKRIDLKNSWVLMVTVLITAIGGCIAAFYISKASNGLMSGVSIVASLFLGLRFLIKPITAPVSNIGNFSPAKRVVRSIICGVAIGFVCGFMGAGGGIMMLLLLTTVLGFELKSAVGTSVFIMTFTALVGAVSHFVIAGGLSQYWGQMLICIASTFVFAQVASAIANKANNKLLNRIVGGLLTVLSILMIVVEFCLKPIFMS